MLGPLVVAAASFRIPDGDGPSLRERTSGIWCKAGSSTRGAVHVDDSKEVHRRLGVAGLARGVLSAIAASGKPAPTDLADWLRRFADRGPDAFVGDPWFERPEDEPLPACRLPKNLRERMLLRGVEALSIVVSPATPVELNSAWDATDNKGRVLFLATMTLLVRVLGEHPGEDVHVTLDREGGRLDYEGYLADVFPWHPLRREPAKRGTTRYVLEHDGRRVLLTFATGADRHDLACGLASMAAKLTRELFMARLNAWFRARKPDLEKTAGYFEDGRRFLRDAGGVLEAERVDLRRLVRTR